MMEDKIKLNDSGVLYDPVEHTYTLNGKSLQGITTTLVERAYPKDKTYEGISENMLRHAARRGTDCHLSVQKYYEDGFPLYGYEEITERARQLLESVKLTPVRFEYVVTDYETYASPIDIVCVNDKGEICIVDMKYTAKLLYEHVTLQTSIYKRFFSLVNPKLTAKHLYVLWIHTNDNHTVMENGIYELTPCDDKFIDDLIAADRANETFDVTKYYGELPKTVAQVEDYMVQLSNLVKEKTDELNEIKNGLCKMMLERGIKSYSSKRLSFMTVTPKPRESFDSARFKADNPEEYAKYIKTSEVKPSVRITIKE